MDNNRLNYIKKVAEYGSISKAAEEVFITSSALSKYIKKIEKEYGIVLFDRVGKRFELTYAGERYLEWLSEIDVLYDQMETEMHDIANSYTGRIRVGVQIGGSVDIIDRVLPDFIRKFPGFLIELEEDTYSTLRHMLEDNELDLALLPDDGLSSTISTISLMKEQLALFAPKGDPIGTRAVEKRGFRYPWLDLRDLTDVPFIAPYPDQGAYLPFRILSEEYGFKFHINVRARTVSRMLRFVQSGYGCTLSPDAHILSSSYRNDFDLFSIGRKPHVSEFVIAYNKSHYLNHAADTFIELCRASIDDQIEQD